MKYTIKKNRHRSRPIRPMFWFGRKAVSYAITFDKECWYDSHGLDTPKGINKLWGWAYCLHGEKTFGKIPVIKNLVNSQLIGWNPAYAEGRIHLYDYGDIKGKEHRNILQTPVEVNVTFYLDVWISKRYINMELEIPINDTDFKTETIKHPKPKIMFGYYLRFYFGGLKKSVWKMGVTITRI